MKLKKLKNIFTTEEDITDKQIETAYTELIEFLDERSLTLGIRETKEKDRQAWKILQEHYATSKPRIITLYNELTTLQKFCTETITKYLLRAGQAVLH